MFRIKCETRCYLWAHSPPTHSTHTPNTVNLPSLSLSRSLCCHLELYRLPFSTLHIVSAAYRLFPFSCFTGKLLPFNVSHVSHEHVYVVRFLQWNANARVATRSNVYVYQSVILMIVPMNVWWRAF